MYAHSPLMWEILIFLCTRRRQFSMARGGAGELVDSLAPNKSSTASSSLTPPPTAPSVRARRRQERQGNIDCGAGSLLGLCGTAAYDPSPSERARQIATLDVSMALWRRRVRYYILLYSCRCLFPTGATSSHIDFYVRHLSVNYRLIISELLASDWSTIDPNIDV